MDGDTIAAGPLMSTMMSCGEEIDAHEWAIRTALENAATWSISGDTAELRGGDDDQIQLTLQSMAATAF